MSSLNMEEGVRSRPPVMVLARPPYSGNANQQSTQNIGFPTPPTNWINRPPGRDVGNQAVQQNSPVGSYHKQQVKKVYQVKTQSAGSVNHQ